MSDPYREASKFHTADRRAKKRRDDMIERANHNYEMWRDVAFGELSASTRRLVEVAESSPEYVAAVSDVNAQVTADELDDATGELPIPPCLLDPSDPMPVPGIIEVPDRPKRERAARR